MLPLWDDYFFEISSRRSGYGYSSTLWTRRSTIDANLLWFCGQQQFWGRSRDFGLVRIDFFGFRCRDHCRPLQGPPFSSVYVPFFVSTFAAPLTSLAPFVSSVVNLSSGATRDVAATSLPQAMASLDQSSVVAPGFFPSTVQAGRSNRLG